jgi:hypothetical protein
MSGVEWVDLGICRALSVPGTTPATVVFLPGARGGGSQPLLHYTRVAVQQRGWSSLLVWDEFGGDGDHVRWVTERAEAAFAARGTDASRIVAKSLSSFAAGVAAAHRVPAVWFTPLLTEDEVLRRLAQATAPYLLVGGTADPMWDTTAARELTTAIYEIEGADHSLDGPTLDRSLANLQGAVSAAADFVGSPPG